MSKLAYYKLLLIHFIVLNKRNTKHDNFKSLTIDELEEIVKKIINDRGLFAIYVAGMTVTQLILKKDEDMVNGIKEVLDDFLALFGIEPEED